MQGILLEFCQLYRGVPQKRKAVRNVKKVISLILVLALCMTFSLAVSAQAAELYTVDSRVRTSKLTISSTTATCKSYYNDQSGDTSKVVIEQSLEKQSLLLFWSTYAGEWTQTTNGSVATLTNKVYDLPSGTYRVKTVFTVTIDGTTQSITAYSDKATVS